MTQATRRTTDSRLDFAFGPPPRRPRAEAAFRLAELRSEAARRPARLVLVERRGAGGAAPAGLARLCGA